MVSTLEPAAAVQSPLAPVRQHRPGNIIVRWITSTDHKVIGYLYLITSFFFFGFGGILALLICAELARPGLQVVSAVQ